MVLQLIGGILFHWWSEEVKGCTLVEKSNNRLGHLCSGCFACNVHTIIAGFLKMTFLFSMKF